MYIIFLDASIGKKKTELNKNIQHNKLEKEQKNRRKKITDKTKIGWK